MKDLDAYGVPGWRQENQPNRWRRKHAKARVYQTPQGSRFTCKSEELLKQHLSNMPSTGWLMCLTCTAEEQGCHTSKRTNFLRSLKRKFPDSYGAWRLAFHPHTLLPFYFFYVICTGIGITAFRKWVISKWVGKHDQESTKRLVEVVSTYDLEDPRDIITLSLTRRMGVGYHTGRFWSSWQPQGRKVRHA